MVIPYGGLLHQGRWSFGIEEWRVRRLPHIRHHPLEPKLLLRTLRLNCLVRPYAPLWEELYNPDWQQDSWVPHIGVDYADRALLGQVTPNWQWSTPLRRAADRRQALVEIDAIVAIMLGITAEELTTIYRTQFLVLQKYERDAPHDAHGRQLPGKLASEYRKGKAKPEDFTVDGVTYDEPLRRRRPRARWNSAHKHFSDLHALRDDARLGCVGKRLEMGSTDEGNTW